MGPERLAPVSQNSGEASIGLADTGRTGTAFLGVLGTTSPSHIRCWIDLSEHSLTTVAELIGLEPVPAEAADVVLSPDRWRPGIHDRGIIRWVDGHDRPPARVWCDLYSEPRGADFAAQLWGALGYG